VTALSVIVPTGSGDGPIQVATDVGSAVFSSDVLPAAAAGLRSGDGNEHARAITFKLKKSGAASGVLSSTEDPGLH
jgi:hypothetical protein